ncbi:MAG: DMT family transporter [Pseudomonadota bacterium]
MTDFRPRQVAGLSPEVVGILCMCLAVAMLPIMDGLVKTMTGHLSAVQLAFLRFAAQAVVGLPIVVLAAGWSALNPGQPLIHAARGACHAFATIFFISALAVLPLADTMAIFFVMPLLVTAMSALFLGEAVGIRRWSAVLVGFVGALIVVRPGGDVFSLASLLPMGAATMFGLYVILTRRFVQSGHSLGLNFVAAAWATLILGVLLVTGYSIGLPQAAIAPLSTLDWAKFAVIGAISMFGHWLIVLALARAPASIIAPLTYLEIIGAAIVGYILFADIPDLWTWVGVAVIAASGIYISYRERVRAQTA